MAKAGSTEKVVREIRRHTRRRFSAEEKIRIVLEGLRGEESIAALCRREGLAPNLYYRWSKEFLEAGKKRLLGDTTREATSTEVQDLRRETASLSRSWPRRSSRIAYSKKIWWSPVRGTIRATDRGREARDHPACGGLGSVGAPYAAGAGGSPVHVLRVVSPLPGRGRGRVGPPAGGRPAPLEPYPVAGPAPRRGGRPGRSGKVAPRAGVAIHGPGAPLSLGVQRVSHPQSRGSDHQSGVCGALGGQDICSSDAPAQRVVANRLHLPAGCRVGWYYLSTVLDDYSRYILAWTLRTSMQASDVTETLDVARAQAGGGPCAGRPSAPAA